MQRGFYATQDSCEPRDALRVADEQSFGLCVGFLLRLRRLAARVGAAVMTGHSETGSSDPSKAHSTRPGRRADLSVQGIASVAMRSSVFTPLDNVEEFCPKKLPCAYDTDGPLEHSATAAFDPERPDLARNADAAPLREAFREHISPASIRTDTERKHPPPWASASPSRRSSST